MRKQYQIEVRNARGEAEATTRTAWSDGQVHEILRSLQDARRADQLSNPQRDWTGWVWSVGNGTDLPRLGVAANGTIAMSSVARERLNPPAANTDPTRRLAVSLFVDAYSPAGEMIPDEVGLSWNGEFETAAGVAHQSAREARESDPSRDWTGWQWRVLVDDAPEPLLILDHEGHVLVPKAFGKNAGRVVPDGADKKERDPAWNELLQRGLNAGQIEALTTLRDVLQDPDGTNDREHDCGVAMIEAFGLDI